MSRDPEALVPAEEVLRRGAGRWKTLGSLAAATRGGSAPGGRVLLSSTRAAYRAEDVERFFAEQAARRDAVVEKLRANVARARAAKAARRAAREAAPAPIEPAETPSPSSAPRSSSEVATGRQGGAAC